jgi:succinoglycan biosynthesis transport protein ExoP
MVDLQEEQAAEKPDFQRYLNIARRRQMQFVVPLFIGWLLVWGSSWVLKPKFKSSTLILVEEPTMPKDYVAPNVSDDLQDRMQSITQQILSRTRLLSIIQNLHLYQDGRTKRSPEEMVERMRKDIAIDLVRDTRNNQITAFRIFFTAHDPHVAQEATSALKDLFINETLKSRQEESQGTTKFIEDQLKDASAQLAAQEAKVHDYQATHQGALPEQATSNLQILSGLQAQVQNDQDALNAARQQRVLLQSQLDQYRSAKELPVTPGVMPTGLTAMDVNLATLRAQLVDLSSRYTDSYPDVRKLKEQIAETQKQRDQMAALEKKNAGVGGSSMDAAPGSPQAQLESQLQANKLEIANREQAITGLQQRIGEYEGRLNATPATEQQLAELNRGYDQSKANYDDLLKKKNASEMATSMEELQQGERFTMLDPPSLPAKPDFPNHLMFCGLGLAVGIAFGVLVAGAFEFLDDRLYSEKEIKNLLPVSVISEIPDVVNTTDEANNKRVMVINWAATAAVFVVILAAAAISYLHS